MTNLRNYLSVAIFAFFGGCSRSLLSQWLPTSGIIVANLLGCFLLALLTYYVIEKGIFADWLSTGLGTGFIGAFTTFSSFAVATVHLSQQNWSSAICYFLISSVGGLLMAVCGFLITRRLGKEVHS